MPTRVLVERAVVDRAQADTVGDDGFAMQLEVADDVRGVEQTRFLQSADRAQIPVRGDDAAAEACLVYADPRLAEGVLTFQGILDDDRFLLVERADHPPG